MAKGKGADLSGFGEIAYTLLLGWMRTLTDWVWSIVSGKSSFGAINWFLANWKVWLAALVIGGLAVDWFMWVVRWRPYKLLMSRLRRPSRGQSAALAPQWDSGAGFYAPESPADLDRAEWTELTLSTLSEIDPDWAGSVVMERETDEPYPEDEAMEPPAYESGMPETEAGFWQETPDEMEEGDPEPDGAWADEPEAAQDDAWREAEVPPDEPVAEPVFDDGEEAEAWADASQTPEPVETYARPGMWPGFFHAGRRADDSEADAAAERWTDSVPSEPDEEPAYADAEEDEPVYAEPAFAETAYEEPVYAEPTLEPPVGRSPRRRRFRESDRQNWRPEDPMPYDSAPAPHEEDAVSPASPGDDRPERVVSPRAEDAPVEKKRRGLWTVTGKPARRRGLFSLADLTNEPIAGLPPLELDDPFLPAAKPVNPDFDPDDGEEYPRK